MLTELAIRDIALIPRLRLRFGPGLNVLSGETGAGKSLVVGSLRLLCGERASSKLVRTGAERGFVEGVFELDPHGWIAGRLGALGLELEDGELILSREIAASGKGRVRANGSTITRATLSRAAEILVDLHGQHDHQSLLRPSFQLEALDEFAGVASIRDTFSRAYTEWTECAEELEAAERACVQDRERAELARFQLRELDEASLEPGELAKLETERARLERAQFLRQAAGKIVESLSEAEGSVRDVVAELERVAGEAARADEDWADVARSLASLAIAAGETARDTLRLGERAVDDPARLEEVRDRARLLGDLLHKYGPGEEELLAFWKRLQDEAGDPEARTRRVARLRERLSEISDRLLALGSELTRARKAGARRLRTKVERGLGELGMQGTRFEARVAPRTSGVAMGPAASAARAGTTGLDSVDFHLAPNRGEDLRRLAAIASGGEISRVMLALKSVLGATRGTATMVFDEIDLGVGGTVAGKIGDVLSGIASDRQVLCITHLAAIASRARSHLRVEKREENGRTVSDVEPVTGERRVREIARMLGSDSAEVAMNHARELLKEVGS